MDIQEYDLETSIDGVKWRLVGRFKDGEKSRFDGAPFDANIMLREANDYVKFWKARHNPANFKYCRIVTNIKILDYVS